MAGKSVGQWIAAEGRATFNAAGRLIALEDTHVVSVDDPAAPYLDRAAVSIETILASAPGPDPEGVIDLDDEELAAFLRAATS